MYPRCLDSISFGYDVCGYACHRTAKSTAFVWFGFIGKEPSSACKKKKRRRKKEEKKAQVNRFDRRRPVMLCQRMLSQTFLTGKGTVVAKRITKSIVVARTRAAHACEMRARSLKRPTMHLSKVGQVNRFQQDWAHATVRVQGWPSVVIFFFLIERDRLCVSKVGRPVISFSQNGTGYVCLRLAGQLSVFRRKKQVMCV